MPMCPQIDTLMAEQHAHKQHQATAPCPGPQVCCLQAAARAPPPATAPDARQTLAHHSASPGGPNHTPCSHHRHTHAWIHGHIMQFQYRMHHHACKHMQGNLSLRHSPLAYVGKLRPRQLSTGGQLCHLRRARFLSPSKLQEDPIEPARERRKP